MTAFSTAYMHDEQGNSLQGKVKRRKPNAAPPFAQQPKPARPAQQSAAPPVPSPQQLVEAGADQLARNRQVIRDNPIPPAAPPVSTVATRSASPPLSSLHRRTQDSNFRADSANQDIQRMQGQRQTLDMIRGGEPINPLSRGLTAGQVRGMGGTPNYAGAIPPNIQRFGAGFGATTGQDANVSGLVSQPFNRQQFVNSNFFPPGRMNPTPPVESPGTTVSTGAAPPTNATAATSGQMQAAPPVPALQRGQRRDESPEQFQQRLADIARYRASNNQITDIRRQQANQEAARVAREAGQPIPAPVQRQSFGEFQQAQEQQDRAFQLAQAQAGQTAQRQALQDDAARARINKLDADTQRILNARPSENMSVQERATWNQIKALTERKEALEKNKANQPETGVIFKSPNPAYKEYQDVVNRLAELTELHRSMFASGGNTLQPPPNVEPSPIQVQSEEEALSHPVGTVVTLNGRTFRVE